ncbi:MAG TPA: hypothetical protein VEV38_09820, partial [Candidatus Eremiobacteraceae bacterium]|nr:hypothetical protein [Candidatus Eremiobacteraceae bacterium]
WLADFVRGRKGEWPDAGARLRVYAIASVVLISSVAAVMGELLHWSASSPINLFGDTVSIGAGIGLFFRSKASYIVTYIFALILTMTNSIAAVVIPLIAFLVAQSQDSTAIDLTFFIYIWIVYWLAALAIIYVWAFIPTYEFFKAIGRRIAEPLSGLYLLGALFTVAWSITGAIVGISNVQTLISKAALPRVSMLTLIMLLLLPALPFGFWMYTTLRSRAVRDAFDLP